MNTKICGQWGQGHSPCRVAIALPEKMCYNVIIPGSFSSFFPGIFIPGGRVAPGDFLFRKLLPFRRILYRETALRNLFPQAVRFGKIPFLSSHFPFCQKLLHIIAYDDMNPLDRL